MGILEDILSETKEVIGNVGHYDQSAINSVFSIFFEGVKLANHLSRFVLLSPFKFFCFCLLALLFFIFYFSKAKLYHQHQSEDKNINNHATCEAKCTKRLLCRETSVESFCMGMKM